MKLSFRVISVIFVCIFSLSLSTGFAADKKEYSTAPPEKAAKKWRIGYLEGGPYKDYQSVLIATVKGLAELGWIEKTDIPAQENNENTDKLWEWLAANVKSKYLEFAPDAYYSNNWNKELRETTKAVLLQRLKEKQDIDLMLALGTWAGQDLANNEHSVPTLVCSVSDAIASKIVKSPEDSGYDHIHARIDPSRHERQIRSFHDVIGFKKLGVAFEESVVGRSYAAIGDIEKVAKDRNFEVITCYMKEDIPDRKEAEESAVKCAAELAPKIDAFYITPGNAMISKSSFPKILNIMNTHKVPTFAQSGSSEVSRGVLLSISNRNFSYVGKFHSEIIGKIINGAKPRDLDQIFEAPVKIAFNKATAEKINLNYEIYNMILNVADETYDNIEEGK